MSIDILRPYLKPIADAIRSKKGTTEAINAQNFATEIANLPSGGSVEIIQEGGYVGTPIPNSGNIDTIYCNVALTPDEINELITNANLTWVNLGDGLLGYIPLNLSINSTTTLTLLIINGFSVGINGYLCRDLNNGLILFNTIEQMAEMEGGFMGWLPELIEANGVVPLSGSLISEGVGTENDKLSGLISASPIEKLEPDVTVLSGTYEWTSLKLTKSGTTDVKALITNEKKIPKTITVKNEKWQSLINGTLQELTAEDFEGIKEIRAYAFYSCESLVSVIIPDRITQIPLSTFYACSSLTSVVIPKSVTSIGNSAFSHCSSLTSIIIPESVTYIYERAFYGCNSLTSIEIPENVTRINPYTFYMCSSLTSVVIPEGVTFIGERAFKDCTSLTDITFNGTVEKWNAITKESRWEEYVPATKVVCSDGEVTL